MCMHRGRQQGQTYTHVHYVHNAHMYTHTHTYTLTHSFHYSTVELEVQATQTNYQQSRLHPLLFRDGIEDFVQDEGRTPSTTASFFDIRIRLAVQVHEIFKVNLHNTIGTIKHLINIRDNYAVTCWYATYMHNDNYYFVCTNFSISFNACNPPISILCHWTDFNWFLPRMLKLAATITTAGLLPLSSL